MTKYLIAAAALVVAGIPAAFGLAGNASFTHDIPVRVPDQVQLTPVAAGDDDGTADQGHGDGPGTAGAGDDRNDDRGGSTSSGSSGRGGSDGLTGDSGHRGGGSDDGSGHD